MANQVPLLEGTDAAGGYLVPANVVPGITFAKGIQRLSAVAGMPGLKIRQVSGKQEKYTDYVGRPTVATVAEGADKPATGAELAQVTLDIVKAAGLVMFTEELIEDANADLLPRIDADIREAFAEYIDQNALGSNSAGDIAGAFNSELAETTQTQELGTTGDAIALAISGAMAKIEAKGYNPTGVILAADGRAALRDARNTVETAMPVYSPGFVQPPDQVYGLPIRYTTNLRPFATAAGAGVVKGIVGDFSQALLGIRSDVRRKVSTEATIDVGGTAHRLWQQNKTAVLWETRVGFVAYRLNDAFCAIVDAS
jgi:HK97 family phage major capsid protein